MVNEDERDLEKLKRDVARAERLLAEGKKERERILAELREENIIVPKRFEG